jgi:hypothetical protein
MAEREKDAVGMPTPIMDYVKAAVGELKFDAWAKYMRPEVVERMRRHFAGRGREWTDLIAQVQAEVKADPEAAGTRARGLGRQWMDLFHDMVGTEQQDIDAFRKGTATDPLLRMGPGIDDTMIGWLRKALAAN